MGSCSSCANIVGFRWLYGQNFDIDENLKRYNDRLVTQGVLQQPDVNVDDTFSYVVEPTTICTILL